MELYLIRHAQSANNHAYDTGGERQPDPPLTELGHRQAQALAAYLATRRPAPDTLQARRQDRGGYTFTHLYTSLMLRAVVTATYVAQAIGLPLRAWTEIHERGGLHGIAPETGEVIGVAGPNRAYFVAEHPHLLLPDTLGESGWWNREREREEEFAPRAAAVWRELLARHGSDDRVALITHGGFYHSFMAVLLGGNAPALPAELGVSGWWLGIANTGITHLSIDDRNVYVCYTNRVEHLPDEWLSS